MSKEMGEMGRSRQVGQAGVSAPPEGGRREIESWAGKAALADDPQACAPVPGAIRLIECLRTTPDVSVAIATGAWEDLGRLRLRHAALPVNDLPLASGDDAISREEIMTISHRRAANLAEIAAFDQIAYVGDQPWDPASARC